MPSDAGASQESAAGGTDVSLGRRSNASPHGGRGPGSLIQFPLPPRLHCTSVIRQRNCLILPYSHYELPTVKWHYITLQNHLEIPFSSLISVISLVMRQQLLAKSLFLLLTFSVCCVSFADGSRPPSGTTDPFCCLFFIHERSRRECGCCPFPRTPFRFE